MGPDLGLVHEKAVEAVDMERPTPARADKRKRKGTNWAGGVLISLQLCIMLAFVGAFSPVFSPLIYPRLAPAGWHNITPHGNIILYDFAVSATTPGLMAACGTSFSVDIRDPSTWNFGFRFWVSSDGGASWQGMHPPLGGNASSCGVAVGIDGGVSCTKDYGQIQHGQWASSSTWVTLDFGKSWQRPPPAPTVTVDGYSAAVTPLLRRAGIWYGLYNTHDTYGDQALTVSSDNGATWHPLTTTPSALVKQGWRASDYFVEHEVVPDYSGDHAWYRVVYMDNQVPVLEHSVDDGQSWTAVGPIGNEFTAWIVLAVNPAQPGSLCADIPIVQLNQLELRSSGNGGKTWRQGSMPPGYTNTVGVNSFSPVMDAQGSCYTGYHFGRGGPQYEGNDGSYCAVMRLPPGADTFQALPLGGYCGLSNGDPVFLTYMPAWNSMSGRLVIYGRVASAGWPALGAGLAGETDDDKVIWMTVP
ncbi:MAG TPA: hypothetical protein VF510_02125 [Ktedonobacterales bacterium]